MTKSEHKEKGKKAAQLPKGSGKMVGYGAVLLFLLVWVFALGVLTGRGDIHRWLQRLGLSQTEMAARLGVGSPPGDTPEVAVLPQNAATKVEAGAAQPTPPATKEPTPEPSPPVAAAVRAEKNAAAAGSPGAVVKKTKGNVKGEAKKGKSPTPAKGDQQHSIAAKLNFQNSLDSQAHKPSKGVAKKEKNVHAATIVPETASQTGTAAGGVDKKKTAVYQVKVASFHDAAAAQKALADLTKKGFKVSLQQGKDKTGQTYTIQTPRFQSKAEAEKVAKTVRKAKMTGQVQELKP